HDPTLDAPFRALWERGINGSHLYRHTKLVALTLATHADWATGHIADEDQPRMGRLIDLTGLHPGQVVVSLNVLEQRGWIVRDDRRMRWNVASVQLAVPGPIMRRLKKACTTS
ncbi:MarR family transcriptional regulator, partial [Streptomyces venezuelae]